MTRISVRGRAALQAVALAALLVCSGSALARVAGAMDPPNPWETAARLHVTYPNRATGKPEVNSGSGTVVRSDANGSFILTCAHLFSTPGQLTIDLFDPEMTRNPGEPGKLKASGETFPGTLLDLDPGKDVAIVMFQPGRNLPASPLLPTDRALAIGDRMIAVGCSEGRDATVWSTSVNRLAERDTQGGSYTRCTSRPAHGRSGGGLFTSDGYVAGVANYQEQNEPFGGYASPDSVRFIVERTGLFRRAPQAQAPCPPGVTCPTPQSPQVQAPRPEPGLGVLGRRKPAPPVAAPEVPTPSPDPSPPTIAANPLADLDRSIPPEATWLAVPAGLALLLWPKRPSPGPRLAA